MVAPHLQIINETDDGPRRSLNSLGLRDRRAHGARRLAAEPRQQTILAEQMLAGRLYWSFEDTVADGAEEVAADGGRVDEELGVAAHGSLWCCPMGLCGVQGSQGCPEARVRDGRA